LDKVAIKFFADVLYAKEKLSIEEYEDIMEAKTVEDLDIIVDKMLKEEYNTLLRGESYGRYAGAK